MRTGRVRTDFVSWRRLYRAYMAFVGDWAQKLRDWSQWSVSWRQWPVGYGGRLGNVELLRRQGIPSTTIASTPHGNRRTI
jgi:hypothetical protein